MQRKPLFLAAAVAELLRFVAMFFLAESLGMVSAMNSVFLRYAAAPQLLFGAAFFFLWLDREHYAAFRPLALVGKILGFASFLPLALSLLSLGPDRLPNPRAALIPAGLCFSIDLFGFVVLALSGHSLRRAAKAPVGMAQGEIPLGDGPRGPDEFERVEA